MSRWLYKYTTAQTAASVLLTKKLRWSAPELFNDPFEFKNPFQFNFEWNALEALFVDEAFKLVTQDDEPKLVEGGPTVKEIRALRRDYKGGLSIENLLEILRSVAATIVEHEKKVDPVYVHKWQDMKRKYRVLCLSEIASDILMWSHYADSHRGVVLGFHIDKEVTCNVVYRKEVPSPFPIEDLVGFLTSQVSQPTTDIAFRNCVYAKSDEWSYEREIRLFRKSGISDGLFDDFEFDPDELKEIYFGCRTPESSKEEIIAAAKTFQAPISFYRMLDEPLRFELTPVKLPS